MSTIASLNGVDFSLSLTDSAVTRPVEFDMKSGDFMASELQDDTINIFGLPNSNTPSQVHHVVPLLVNEQLLFTSLVHI